MEKNMKKLQHCLKYNCRNPSVFVCICLRSLSLILKEHVQFKV